MGILHQVISDGGIELCGDIGDAELEALFEEAIGRCSDEADRRNLYLCDALDNIDRFRDFEPDAEEVREHLRPEDYGDWRKTLTAAAYLATREYLGAIIDKEIDSLKAAVMEATERGYTATALLADCPWGWAAHSRETTWQTGTLYLWQHLDGDVNVTALSVGTSAGDTIWVRLERVV